jgi:hypothetical protein
MFSTVTETALKDLNGIGTERVEIPAAEARGEEMDSRVVLGNRQMAAVAFVILALLALVSAMAYLAGRVMTAAQVTPQAGAARAPEQVIVVDAKPAAPVVVSPAAAVEAEPVEVKPSSVKPAVAVAKPGPVEMPKAGEVYFQVGSVDRGMAEVSVEYIRRNGLEARIAPGATAEVFRVLVGPVGTAEAPVAEIEARLKGLGFTPFVKKY